MEIFSTNLFIVAANNHNTTQRTTWMEPTCYYYNPFLKAIIAIEAVTLPQVHRITESKSMTNIVDFAHRLRI